ncbi:helix-turn-helix domain-containing protein [Streptomyces sp. NPDC052496]|uniref:nSTAND1 domain-containing NTPase n=1 Tax=Streptomyces sp. NPDC052496 TaxID=3154951 RepID=UPI003433AA35
MRSITGAVRAARAARPPARGVRDGMQEEFGDALRRLRRDREVSLRTLAQLVHYSKGYLSKIENGEKPPTGDVARRCDAALAGGGALTRLLSARTPGDRCPYPGLAAYTADDAPWFFGRERATAALVGRLAERLAAAGPLVVAAPSGAGKSSLLRAGLLPALRAGALPGSRHWAVRVLTPGAHPLTELATALTGPAAAPSPAEALSGPHSPATPAAVAAAAEDLADAPERCPAAVRAALGPCPRLILVVDQFEEIFTACEDPRERRAFVAALCAAARDAPCAVILCVRADFYGQCLDHPALAPALSAGIFALRPMSVPEVRAAITRPAREAALELEPGLEELLLSDLGIHEDDGPVAGGTLPLLAHALLATWQQRSGRTLTVAGYRLTGGLHGAVATTAERVHAALDPAERRAARQVLLRLVQVGEIAGETRRRVPHERLLEHLPDPEKTAAVIDVFVRARLLTLDADTVEITHEALLRAWPRLRGWIRADRAGLLVHQRLSEAAGAWKREGREAAGLYRGTRLAVAREWAGQQGEHAGLSPLEEEFLHASQTREAAAARAERRRVRRRRRLAGSLAVLLVLAVCAGVLAVQQWRTAESGRLDAYAGELAARSGQVAAGQPEAAILLAAEAYRLRPSPASRSALLSSQARPFAGRLTGHQGPVNAAAFSPGGQLLAGGSSDGTVRLWDPRTRRPAGTAIRARGTRIRGVAFSPDGRLLAAGASDGSVRVRDTGRGAPVTTVPGAGPGGEVAFAPAGAGAARPGPAGAAREQLLAATGPGGSVALWEAPRMRLAARLPGRGGGASGKVAFSPDGRLLARGDGEGRVRVWRLPSALAASASGSALPDAGRPASPTVLADRSGHGSGVVAVAFSPDSATLAVGGTDRTVTLYDTRDMTVTGRLTGHNDDINALAFCPDGDTLASASGDGSARLWEVATRRPVAAFAGHSDYVLTVAFSPDGRTLATGSFDRTLTLWHPSGTALTARPVSGRSAVAFAPGGRQLAAAGTDGSVQRWDVRSRTQLGPPLRGHRGAVRGLAYSRDGRTFATAGADGTVRLWNAASGAREAVLTGARGAVFAVAFAPGGRWLAGASEDGTVRLWDRARGGSAVLTEHDDFVNGVAFSPDGRLLASASDDRTVRLWDAATRRPVAVLRGHTGAVWAVAFSADGRVLASAGNDRTVRLWDVRRHRVVGVLRGHTGSVRDIAFAPRGRQLATAGFDGTVRVWDTAARTQAATLTGHTDVVWSVAYAPDGRTLASTGADGSVRLWDLDARRVAGRVCPLAGRTGPARWRELLPDVPYAPICDH